MLKVEELEEYITQKMQSVNLNENKEEIDESLSFKFRMVYKFFL